VAPAEQVPEVDTLCTKGAFSGFGIDDDAEHGIGRWSLVVSRWSLVVGSW
jgi:hypothetical protein